MAFVDIMSGHIAPLLSLAAGLGVFSHLAYFIHGEHHRQALNIAISFLTMPGLLAVFMASYGGMDLKNAFLRSVATTLSYLTSLSASIIIYRVFFHPLRKFPGPFGAKISKLWHVAHIAQKYDNFRLLDRLHQQHGDFVRTGPSEITIFDPTAVALLSGPRSKCTRAPWYDASLPLVSMHTTRDKAAHDKRRRIWDLGFTTSALAKYERRVSGHAVDLVQQIKVNAGKPMNISKWFNYYSFDVMADIAFGKPFNMVKSGEEHFALELLREGMEPVGLLGPTPWVFKILAAIPGAGAGYKKFLAWTAEQIEIRRREGATMDMKDVTSNLIETFEKSSQSADARQWLHGDSRLIIVAGSDTTAATLTYLFYNLALNPKIVEKLLEELAPLVKGGDEFSYRDIQNAELLNGVINETLRLHPPVPGGMLRVTPPDGLTVGNTFIPGGVTVVSPTFTVGRLERCHEHADKFIPERWFSHPELVKDKSGWAPFSLGSFSCVGKQLALMELRTVTAKIVTQFKVGLAPGEHGTDLLENSRDCFTIAVGSLNLVFTPRN